MWHHGMRFEKTRAESYLSQIVHLNHSHVDVIQIHRADNLAFDDDDNDPIVVKLSGRENDSLILLFQNSVNLGGKTKRYRTGFLQDFGYFARNTFPTYEEHIVTHAQAYNASAKIVRFADIGFVAAYLICGGYKTGDRLDRTIVLSELRAPRTMSQNRGGIDLRLSQTRRAYVGGYSNLSRFRRQSTDDTHHRIVAPQSPVSPQQLADVF